MKPLVDYLRKATGMKIQLRTGFTFEKVFDNIKNGYYDFAYVATTQYAKIKKTVDVQLVGITTRTGRTSSRPSSSFARIRESTPSPTSRARRS